MYSTANPVIIDINLNWTKKVQKKHNKAKNAEAYKYAIFDYRYQGG